MHSVGGNLICLKQLRGRPKAEEIQSFYNLNTWHWIWFIIYMLNFYRKYEVVKYCVYYCSLYV